MTWDFTNHVMKICDGTNWLSMDGGSSSGTAGYIQFSGGSGAFTSDSTSGGQLYWDSTNHRLGIGTQSPTQKLDVRGTIRMANTDWVASTTGTFLDLSLGATSGNTYAQLQGYTNGGTNPANIVLNPVSGFVGIGTTAPTQNLDVSADTWATIASSVADATNAKYPAIIGQRSRGTTASRTVVASGDRVLAVQGKGYDGSAWLPAGTINFEVDGTPGTNDMPGRIVFGTTADGSATTSERMRIDSTGNVGIGTTAPITPIQILGASGTNFQIRFANSATNQGGLGADVNGFVRVTGTTGVALGYGTPATDNTSNFTEIMRVHSANGGSVGIGTQSPIAKLQIKPSSGSQIGPALGSFYYGANSVFMPGYLGFNVARNESTQTWTVSNDSANNGGSAIAGDIFGDIRFLNVATAGTTDQTLTDAQMVAKEAVRISRTGNVGIGTSAPSYLLSLSGEAARTIGMERTAAGTNGYGLTLLAGGAKSSTSNLNGGDLTLSAGTATGTGSSNLYFKTAAAGTTGTADRAPATAMTILGSGNVGIGTTTPTDILTTRSATPSVRLEATGGGSTNVSWLKAENVGAYLMADENNALASSYIRFGVDGSEYVRITSAGRLGIGITAPANTLHVVGGATLGTAGTAGTDQTFLDLVTKGGDTLGLGASASARGWNLFGRGDAWSAATAQQNDFGLSYWNGSVWRVSMTADSLTGNVGIGTTSPTELLTVNGNVLATTYLYSSDRRLKTDIAPLLGQLAKVNALEPVTYTMKADEGHTKRLGLIAQDVEAIYPEVVHTNANGMKAIDYAALVAPLIDALKELKAANDNLTARVEVLEAQARASNP